MGLAEQWAYAQQDADDLAEAYEVRDSLRADELRKEFDALVQARDLNAETGIKHSPRLVDLMGEACGLMDDTIFKQMMQGLIHCAAKGQIEAVEGLEGLKQFFVEQVMEEEAK